MGTRLGLLGVYYAISLIRNPPNKKKTQVILKAPIVSACFWAFGFWIWA